jgi:hypothetical protein
MQIRKRPGLADEAAGRIIANGRLAGRALDGGAFNTLELDYDGMIAYTRWDYVDRDNDIAHHLWLCYPDGRDPRSYHANYPVVRESRPWMELSIRSIPGSRRYVAVAAPHHGCNYGSLVLIDQSQEDDNAMSKITRLTPEVHFPESESAPGQPLQKGTHRPNGEVYGSPWPLSGKFHLCVYDSDKRHYGIYLIDCFGNKELLWRDPAIGCLDPIPPHPRARPPVIPTATCQAKVDQLPDGDNSGTIAIQNVYASDFKWPEGTRIEAIRVVRLFPKSTFHMNEPMVGAGAESLTRGVIGTAPVEADGSAHFKVPTGVPIYFQALDEDGLAVQSMRSATCVHPGERLSCVGCHEPKQQTPSQTAGTPLAWQQAPAILQPESSDALPISFPRLVQPVLDKHCTSCHAGPDSIKAGAPDLSGRLTGPHGWSAAFTALKPHAWAHNGGNGIIFKEGARSEAGKIGARASRLLTYLITAHHEVRLDPEEMRRITLWLDCNSNYYGAYHDLQAQGKVFIVTPDGKAVWEHPAPNCNDLWVLPGGNLLFNTGHGVKEVTRDKQVVFNYQSKSEIYACQRLENGDTFIAECNSGRLLEVKPDGTTSDRVSSRFHVPAWRGWPRRSVCPSGRTFSRSQGNGIRRWRPRVSTGRLRRG